MRTLRLRTLNSFYLKLPEKRKCIAEGFEEEQKDDEEIAKGKQVIIKPNKEKMPTSISNSQWKLRKG